MDRQWTLPTFMNKEGQKMLLYVSKIACFRFLRISFKKDKSTFNHFPYIKKHSQKARFLMKNILIYFFGTKKGLFFYVKFADLP